MASNSDFILRILHTNRYFSKEWVRMQDKNTNLDKNKGDANDKW